MNAMQATELALPKPAGQAMTMRSGFIGLVRKDVTEWRRSRRAVVVLVVTTGIMALLSINSWLQTQIPEAADMGPVPAPVLDPLVNLIAAASAQIFILATIFAVMNVLMSERDSGTLAWTASKPVSRPTIWLAKFISSTAALCVVAGLVPLAATAGLVLVLYGPLPLGPVVTVAVGIGMAIALYVAVCLAASTIVSSQAAVAAIGLAVVFVPDLIGAALPIVDYLPTSILHWSLATAAGLPAGFVTVGTWALAVALLISFSARRMDRIEL